MTPWGRKLMAVALAPALLVAAPAGAADAADDGWLVVRDPRFTVYTNGRPRVADLVTRNLGAVHEVILGLNPELQPRFEVPTWVLAFNTWESWIPYQTDRNGHSQDAAGLFVDHPVANILALAADPDYDPYPILYHEYTHYLLSTVLPDLPPWLDEGLAEYFGSMWIFPDRVELGGKIKWHLAELHGMPWLPLDRLLRVGHDDDEYNEETRRGIFYAQSWALVHYLMQSSPTDLAAVQDYMERLRRGDDPQAALAAAFKQDLTGLEARLRAHALKGKFKPVRLGDLASLSTRQAGTSPAPQAEILTRLGMYLVISDLGARDQPERLFRASLAAQPENPAAYTGLGLFHDVQDRPEEAAAAYRRALEQDPGHEPACLLLALVHLQRHLQDQTAGLQAPAPAHGGGRPAGLHPDLAEARQLLKHAMDLNPRRPESVVGYGYTYIGDPGDLTPGIQALEKARTLFPGRADLAMNLGVLYLRQGEPDAARALFRRVRDEQPTAEAARRAEEALILMAVDDAVALLAEGDYDGGLALLRDLRGRTDDTRVWSYIRSIEEDAARAQATAADLEASNRQAAQGNLDEAMESLEAARSHTDDPEVAARIQEQLRAMEALRSLQEQLDMASALLREGKLDEGAALLRRIRAGSDNAELNAAIDGQLADIRRVQEEDRQVALYNQATELIGLRRFREAADLLDEILADPVSPRVESAARDLLETLETRLQR